MIVSCEKCNKRYRVHFEKLKTSRGTIKCVQCGHRFQVIKKSINQINQETARKDSSAKSGKDSLRPTYSGRDYEARLREAVLKRVSQVENLSPLVGKKASSEKTPPTFNPWSNIFKGLWAKMVLLFFLIPIFVIAISGMISLWQLKTLTTLIGSESHTIATSLAEEKISEICRTAAFQSGVYLKAHPQLRADQFMQNPVLKQAVLKPVGNSSFTLLYQMPNQKGVLRVWGHHDPALIGRNLVEIEKASPAILSEDNYKKLINILMGVKGLKESSGRYQTKDMNGNIRDKYMVCTPIEGTPYVIAATAFMDEFAQSVRQFEARAGQKTHAARQVLLIALLTTMLTTGTVVFIYGQRLTRSITELTDKANRISFGDLGVTVKTDRMDEIGELANAIDRMQESVRLSLKRIRSQKNIRAAERNIERRKTHSDHAGGK